MSSEDIRFDSVSADDESSERNSIYFSTVRSKHTDGLFCDVSFIQKDKPKKSIIRYPSYNQINPNKICLYPHLILNRLSFSRDLRSSSDKALLRLPVLKQEFHNITFELKSGEIMGILYTKQAEIECLLKVLSGSNEIRGKINGEIFINGHRMRKNHLEKSIAYVSNENPCGFLTARQYLHIFSKFNPPFNEHFGGTIHMINKLISDLGLFQVSDIICNRLNRSQWNRLKVAAQLIRDPVIVLCEDILKEIDLHDQCFLIDYLRDWAIRKNRIIIMATTPNNIEQFQMFSKVFILASGRIAYCGNPEDMKEYFDKIGCPCPPFKNICDYYVDLVTHDNLTMEASRESSIRIARLVAKWNQLSPTISKGPTGKVLLNLPTGGIFAQFFALIGLFWFDFINNKSARIFSLILIFLISSFFSFFLSDLPLVMPESFLNRTSFIDFFIFYLPIIFGFLRIKQDRHQWKEFFKLSIFRNHSKISMNAVLVFRIIFKILIDTFICSIPIISFIDFRLKPKQDNLIIRFLSIYIFLFLSFLISNLISFLMSAFQSSTSSYFGFLFLYTILYISSGFSIIQSENMIKLINPLSFISFKAFKLLYSGNFSVLDLEFEKSTPFNISSPIRMFSCGRTFLNSSQITKGPCQKVSSIDLLEYYGFNNLKNHQMINPWNITEIYTFLWENYFYTFFFVIFLIFIVSFIVFNSKILTFTSRKC